jgi:hypothetical protein
MKNKTIFAFTEDCLAPAYINCSLENGDVIIRTRSRGVDGSTSLDCAEIRMTREQLMDIYFSMMAFAEENLP